MLILPLPLETVARGCHRCSTAQTYWHCVMLSTVQSPQDNAGITLCRLPEVVRHPLSKKIRVVNPRGIKDFNKDNESHI